MPSPLRRGCRLLAKIRDHRGGFVRRNPCSKNRATMIERSGEVSIASGVAIGLVALALGSFPFSARAQPADLVLCDRLAADPADPDKPSDIKGTPEIAQSDVATAIKFCRTASTASRRALYQLGRAYAANQQLPEALSAFRRAADKGSTSAMVELGVLLATGSGAFPKTKFRHRNCSSALPKPAIRAASPTSRRSTAIAARRRIRSSPGRCWRERQVRIRPKRSISSD